MELRDYLRILRRDWLMIALVTLLIVGLSLAYTYSSSLARTAPTYEATTWLFVSGSPSNDDVASDTERLSTTRVTSYAALVNGDALTRRVVKRLGLSETPNELASKITVSTVPDSVILEINVTDASADRAQLLADTLAKELGPFGTELETVSREARATVKATIIDRDVVPTSATAGPRPLRNLVLGLVFGFLAGFGLAVVREAIKTEGVESSGSA